VHQPYNCPFGETIGYTVVVQNSGAALSGVVSPTDTVPFGHSYVGGSLTGTGGTADDLAAPTLRWQGMVSAMHPVTIRYAATVAVLRPRTLTNTVMIAAPGCDPLTRTARVQVDWRRAYLPALSR